MDNDCKCYICNGQVIKYYLSELSDDYIFCSEKCLSEFHRMEEALENENVCN